MKSYIIANTYLIDNNERFNFYDARFIFNNSKLNHVIQGTFK